MQVFSVAQFITYVNETFKAIWDPTAVAVEGEVSNFRISQGQWVNFDLKDEEGLISVFMVLRNVTVPVQDGMRVRLYGYPRIYPKYGKFSFSADRIEIVGEGGLRKALELLRQKLDAEGLFDPTRKRTLPRFPKRIALVASRESAAYGDFIRIVNERWCGLEIDVYHVLVQGRDAPESIVSALKTVFTKGKEVYDVIVLTRGGGSLEELMAFNDERVVRAIHASTIPTLVGIGHERDITLAEEAADVRGSTPTDCARRLVPDKRDILLELASQEEAMLTRVENVIQHHLRALERATTSADRWMMSVQERLARCVEGLEAGILRWYIHLKDRLESLERLIRSADPELILKRGYALVSGADGKLIAKAAQTQPGDVLSICFADGKVGITVNGQEKNLRLF